MTLLDSFSKTLVMVNRSVLDDWCQFFISHRVFVVLWMPPTHPLGIYNYSSLAQMTHLFVCHSWLSPEPHPYWCCPLHRFIRQTVPWTEHLTTQRPTSSLQNTVAHSCSLKCWCPGATDPAVSICPAYALRYSHMWERCHSLSPKGHNLVVLRMEMATGHWTGLGLFSL